MYDMILPEIQSENTFSSINQGNRKVVVLT